MWPDEESIEVNDSEQKLSATLLILQAINKVVSVDGIFF